MSPFDRRVAALAGTALAWREPDHPARKRAADATLAGGGRLTEEGVAFAVNQATHLATPDALTAWAAGRETSSPREVPVMVDDPTPFAGFRRALAALLAGHRLALIPHAASPFLLAAFLEEARQTEPALAVRVEAASKPLDEPAWATTAILDGRETAEEKIGLAEDALLHDGQGKRSVRVLWAPAALAPDAYLDAFAGFRELFPPHPATDAALRMPAALLAGAKLPHAQGPGFLLSKGAPEPQGPGHVRWATYEAWSEVDAWLAAQGGRVPFVVAPARVAARLRGGGPFVAPGDAHRPPLAAPGERDPFSGGPGAGG